MGYATGYYVMSISEFICFTHAGHKHPVTRTRLGSWWKPQSVGPRTPVTRTSFGHLIPPDVDLRTPHTFPPSSGRSFRSFGSNRWKDIHAGRRGSSTMFGELRSDRTLRVRGETGRTTNGTRFANERGSWHRYERSKDATNKCVSLKMWEPDH